MQLNDAQTPRGNADAHLAYALDFRAMGVALMRRERGVATLAKGRKFSVTQRPGGAWSEIAFCDWRPSERGGRAAELNAPERLIAALGEAPPEIDIWLPADIVLSRAVEDAGASPDEPAQRIAARAMPGLTILRPEALEIAATRTEAGVALKAVERSVLEEVSAHARRWGFAVRSVRSRPGDPHFPDGAVFAEGGAERPRAGLGAPPPRALGLIGGAAIVAALALYMFVDATGPSTPEDPGASARATVAADPAPPYQKLKAEIPFSAPAPQFTPIAEAPELSAAPAIEDSGPPPAPKEASSIDPEPLAVRPADPPLDVADASDAPAADAPTPAVGAPGPLETDRPVDLAALSPMPRVPVDAAAGDAGVDMAVPGESAPPEGEPTPPDATAPVSETPSDPPAKPQATEEMGDADFAALTLRESPVPMAPPAPAQLLSDPPPPAPRPSLRPGTSPEEPLKAAGEEENRIPVSERAPEAARPPKPRPKAIAKRAAEDAPLALSALAPEAASAPRPRPAHIRELPAKLKAAAERAWAERAAKAAERRGSPTAAAIAAVATQHMEWETLDGFILIGVFERVEGRSALIRLPNGDVRRVEAGDRIGRWTVASVSASAVSLKFEGRSQTLHMPGAN